MLIVMNPSSSMRRIKNFVKRMVPGLVNLRNYWRARNLKSLTPEHIFTSYYEQSAWGDPDTRSGQGSNLERTAFLRRALPALISELSATSILDIPCGDYYWMQQIDLQVPNYIGADIVTKIIENNNERFSTEKVRFQKLDLLNDSLPCVDVILCRDCLVHFSYDNVFKAIRNIQRSNSKYLLVTTFQHLATNTDIYTGDWRPLNLQRPPFNFPEPIKLLDEHSPWSTDIREGKSLGLWKICDL